MISFVGAGPGASDLITVRGRDRLEGAEIVVWASSLIPEELLEWAPKDAIRYDSAQMTLEDVFNVYAAHREAPIVRLHSGDPSIYGALQEQLDWCEHEGIDYEIVPGVTSISAAAAVIGRELTIPGVSQSIVTTRLANRTHSSMPPNESVARYTQVGGTLAVLLSGAHPANLQRELLGPDSVFTETTPAVIVVRATWPDQVVAHTTLGDLATTMANLKAKRTVLVLVGESLQAPAGRSHLYSPSFAHRFRARSTPGTTSGRPKGRARSSLR
ncbi:MAG: precorrin-4 C(11)-methyltransferase [Ferrimicrobium sp.]